MAGDWIKVEHATVDKPEIVAMADLLGTSVDDVFGKLVRIWMWFDKQSSNGNAGSVSGVTLMTFLDRLVGSQGFAACMKKVGWLTDQGMPNFERHNGESAKKRALTKDRLKRFRNDDVTLNALPEKRREEKIKTNTPPVDKKKRKTPLPEKFGLSPQVIAWAQARGFGDLQAHLDSFLLKAAASDYRYVDWDRALMNAIAGDWAGLRRAQRSLPVVAAAHSAQRSTEALEAAKQAREAAVPMPAEFAEKFGSWMKKATH